MDRDLLASSQVLAYSVVQDLCLKEIFSRYPEDNFDIKEAVQYLTAVESYPLRVGLRIQQLVHNYYCSSNSVPGSTYCKKISKKYTG